MEHHTPILGEKSHHITVVTSFRYQYKIKPQEIVVFCSVKSDPEEPLDFDVHKLTF